MSNFRPRKVELDWSRQYRLVSSSYPPIRIFEDIAPSEDLEILYELETLTNDRLREQAGELAFARPEDRVTGPNASVVMAAFTHVGCASRFTDGSYGVYYAARELRTAIAETRHHREAFLRATREPSCEITLRAYIGRVGKRMHDIRSDRYAVLHDPDSYAESQEFAARLREADSWGLVYRSVRDPEGECIAALRPPAVTLPRQGGHYRYVWDGARQRIVDVLEVRGVKGV